MSLYVCKINGTVVEVIDEDEDYHKGTTDYLIKFYTYCPVTNRKPNDTVWVKGGFFGPNWQQLYKGSTHPAWILYGKG